MTLRGKLIVTLAIILSLVGLQTAVTILFVTQAVEGSAQLLGPAFSRVDNLAHLDADVLRLRAIEQSYLFNADAERPQHAAEMTVLLGDIEHGVAAYRAVPLDTTRAKVFARVVSEYRDYLVSHDQSMRAAQSGDSSEAIWIFLAAQPRFNALENDLHQLRHQEYAATQDTNDQMVQAISRARWPLGAIFFVVAIVEAGLGWYVLRSTTRSLNILTAGARRIASEDFSQPVPAVPERELAVLGSALNHAMEELTSNQEARRRLEDERLRLLRERLSQVVQAQEKERRRVSRDLHDQAGQALTALKYGLNRLDRLMPSAEATAEIDRLVALANETGREISALARELRPSVLDDLGLMPALRSYSRELSQRTGLPIDLVLRGSPPRLSSEAETTVFRVVQEALTNVARHAQASHATVDLAVEGPTLRLRIRDDGIGFVPRPSDKGRRLTGNVEVGLGLAGIQERVHLLNGSFELTSTPGKGTEIVVAFPLTAIVVPDQAHSPVGVAG